MCFKLTSHKIKSFPPHILNNIPKFLAKKNLQGHHNTYTIQIVWTNYTEWAELLLTIWVQLTQIVWKDCGRVG